MKTSNSVCDEKMKDSKETSSTEHREDSIRPDRPVHHFGEYPGAPFGTTWKNRTECFAAGVHGQLEPGIHGIKEKGAFSIVVSGQYRDDKDYGDTMFRCVFATRATKLYADLVPSGGNKLGDHTREQVCDQQWTNTGNRALLKSFETGEPVRVIRGYELDSEFAPWEGFRYDGLYICKRAWREKNRDGYYYICRYTMEASLPNDQALIGLTSVKRGFQANHPYTVVQRCSAVTSRYQALELCSRQRQPQ
ncbi:PUA-like domain-containing protein [Suillus cothurnatus]|nr:PUA-like domain-containing protein [Suillus cothurnatus]